MWVGDFQQVCVQKGCAGVCGQVCVWQGMWVGDCGCVGEERCTGGGLSEVCRVHVCVRKDVWVGDFQ